MIKVQRNAHQGKRVFVVGSGPSIKNMDLSALKNEIVICVNESYKAIDWDPDYICIGDKALWPKVKDKYATMSSSIICSTGLNGTVGSEYAGKNLDAVVSLLRPRKVDSDGFCYDLNKGVHMGWNVLSEIVLPFVCWSGFSDCYLVGFDCTNTGYFYNESARGAEFQNIDERAMQTYNIIANMQDTLPTRIWNATAGGNLNAFPRVSYDDMMTKAIDIDDLLVVGYYTNDSNYKKLACNMQQSVQQFGLECVIEERVSAKIKYAGHDIPKGMLWVLNCAICPSFIWDMMQRYPDKNLLYLDADAEMVRFPSLFLHKEFPYDFAAPILTNKYVENELVSNTLFFANTDAAKNLVSLWKIEQDRQVERTIRGETSIHKRWHECWDQETLKKVLNKTIEIRVCKLPYEYAKITPTRRGEELMPEADMSKIVIQQHQASRQNKFEE